MNRPSRPLFATVNVTTACNLECVYCFMQPLSGEHMSRTDFVRVLEELRALNVFFVNISGGEPFVHPEILEFLLLAHERFEHVMTLTNGTALNRTHLATIARIVREKGRFVAQLSVDASDPAINGLTRSHSTLAVRNAARLSERGAQVIVATVVTRANAPTIRQTIEKLSAFTRYFHLMTVQDTSANPRAEADYGIPESDQLRLWADIRKLAQDKDLLINTPLAYSGYHGCAEGAPCMAAFSHLVVDPSLKVRPCDRLTEVMIGDLRESTMQEIWDSPATLPLLQGDMPYCRRGSPFGSGRRTPATSG